ncbi:MAG TPA: arsenic resistance N-acetyltransferase ArsN2 [Gemmatimonadaceae bacterium]|nr:arsenic resistance N-acetyltransferase ArsN2 [Gemmatimonadaceae bacterium]
MTTESKQDPTKVPTTLDEIRATVRSRYGATALRVVDGGAASCCGPAEGSSGCCGSTSESWDPITADLYDAGETAGLPAEALLASLGCGNPTALAELRAGETVLDLGAGGGIDVLLSARRVGPTGKAYGLDMTDEMLALAERNRAQAGATNVEFLKGHIEAIPLPSNSVDVIISNCVINLSGDKRQVLKEAFRVLEPGGRFAVSDIIVREGLPATVKESMALWTGCVAGALEEQEFIGLLTEVGFEGPSIEPTRVYTRDDAAALLQGTGLDASLADQVEGKIMSGFVRATKPTAPVEPGARVRPAVPADLPAVERLLVASDLPLDGVRDAFPTFVVAEAEGEIVGVAGLESCRDDALLRSVAVVDAWRSRGIGRALVTRVISDAEARGCRALYLLTTTAERWFPSFGFRQISREEVPAAVRETEEFRSACPASACVMCRPCATA